MIARMASDRVIFRIYAPELQEGDQRVNEVCIPGAQAAAFAADLDNAGVYFTSIDPDDPGPNYSRVPVP